MQKEASEDFYLSDELGYYVDNNGNDYPIRESFPYKLFKTETSIFPFVKFEEHIAHLNDYIYYNSKNLYKKLNDETNNYKLALENRDIFAEELDFIYDSYLTWEWLVDEVNKCNNIVLLLSFFEGSLKEICEWYCDEMSHIKKRKKKEISKIDYYIDEISDCCNVDIRSSIISELNIIENAKEIRNIFTHEWDAYFNFEHSKILQTELEKFKITQLINAISSILEACENIGIKCGLLF